MPLILLELAAAGALFAIGPVPSDPTTNKPTDAACAAARAQGRTLLGCVGAPSPDEAEVDSAPDPAPPTTRGPSDRFMVCPQDPRCPR